MIEKINQNRSEPPDYSNQETVYIQTKQRDKKLPKFKKAEIIKEKGILLETDKGTYHKNIARRPKNNKNELLQAQQEYEAVDDPVIPGCSNAEDRM